MKRNEAELSKMLAEAVSRLEFIFVEERDPKVADSEGSVSWYDHDHLTFEKAPGEQHIIDCWLLQMFGEKLGYEIEEVYQVDGNGHCTMWFKRKSGV